MRILNTVSGKRLIAFLLSLILFAAVFVCDIPSSRADEPPAETPTSAPTETAQPEPTETSTQTPVPSEESTLSPRPTSIDELSGHIQSPESAAETASEIEPFATSGYFYYTDNGDGTVAITGYDGVNEAITIPNELDGKKVTVIGEHAFSGCLSLSTVLIPSSVKNINDYAFYQCTNLTGAYFFSDAPVLGKDVFNNVSKTFNVYYRSDRLGYTTMWNGWTTTACNPCTAAPYSDDGCMKTSGDYDYWLSDGQATITKYHGSNLILQIPSIIDNVPVTAIGERAFTKARITDITIPGSIRIICTEAFKDCGNLQSVDMLDGVVCIGPEAFMYCWMLRSVYLPASLNIVKNNAFSVCNDLKEITLPENIIGIGTQAFYHCTNLSKVYFMGNAPTLGYDAVSSTVDFNVFGECNADFKVYYLNGKSGFTNPWYAYSTAVFDANQAHVITFDTQYGQRKTTMIVAHNAIISPPYVSQFNQQEFAYWVFGDNIYRQAGFPYKVCRDTTFEARYIPMTTYLSDVKVTAGTLLPGFMYTTKKYKLLLGENDPSVQITAIQEYHGATITINGKAVSSTTVTLANGKSKTITIKVKLGKKSNTYKFTVTRAKSSDNNLVALTPSAGTLSQPFDPSVTNYTVSLDHGTKSVTIKAVKANAMAKVSPASKKLTLKNGQTKVIKFTVKAQSGAKKVYTVTVTRAP